mmetsp:Transcript_100333/g.289687  ORF Transcript_100333/g.289687 Transcript_100333/m.289687 type:complete len:344 (-) Transcript_100333:2576-3607(-)
MARAAASRTTELSWSRRSATAFTAKGSLVLVNRPRTSTAARRTLTSESSRPRHATRMARSSPISTMLPKAMVAALRMSALSCSASVLTTPKTRSSPGTTTFANPLTAMARTSATECCKRAMTASTQTMSPRGAKATRALTADLRTSPLSCSRRALAMAIACSSPCSADCTMALIAHRRVSACSCSKAELWTSRIWWFPFASNTQSAWSAVSRRPWSSTSSTSPTARIVSASPLETLMDNAFKAANLTSRRSSYNNLIKRPTAQASPRLTTFRSAFVAAKSRISSLECERRATTSSVVCLSPLVATCESAKTAAVRTSTLGKSSRCAIVVTAYSLSFVARGPSA